MSAHYSYLGRSYTFNVCFSWFGACTEITGTYGHSSISLSSNLMNKMNISED